MKNLLALVLFLAFFVFTASASAQNSDLYITSTYDRFRDHTQVRLVYPLSREKDLTISLIALGIHKGRVPAEPPPVVIIGMSFSARKGKVDPANKELLALADGKPIDFGIATRLQVDGIEDTERSATYGALVEYGDVRRFAEAGRAEFKFFGVTGSLSDGAQLALNAFVRRLRP